MKHSAPTAFLAVVALAASLCSCSQPGAGNAPNSNPTVPHNTSELTTPANLGSTPMVRVRVIGPDGVLTGPIDSPKLILTDSEWQKRLTPEQYRITRNKGTEPAFCGGLLNNHEPGLYLCVDCGLPLFTSDAKFESKSGWPSFFQPVAPENILERPDRSHGMDRVEILCPRCDAHLGHVFTDGPRPTGLRYCLNSESLRFVPNDQLKSAAEQLPATRPAADSPRASTSAAVFAGGCFWCTEAVFEQLKGVSAVESGYAGGTAETANYHDVCTGTTGHAEAIRITYDPSQVTYAQLLKIFFATHNPTTLNRQDDDSGSQYRSAVFYADAQQKQAAQDYIRHLTDTHAFSGPIVTTLEPLKTFYPAEDYHQDYFRQNPNQPYIRAHAAPKVDKVRQKFPDQVKPK